MGTKYSSNASSGYNATPPDDDGTVSEANKVKWSTIKTKLSDPLKTYVDTINSELATHFDTGPTALSTNTTLAASHHNQIIQGSSAITLTLTDASTLGAGWYCWIKNNDSANTITVARATASDTFDSTTADYSLPPFEAVMVAVNAAANGFYKVTAGYQEAGLIGKAPKSVAAAASMDIVSSTSGLIDVTSAASGTSISSFTTASSGVLRRLLFNTALNVNHNATSMIVPGGSNIPVETNDSALVRSEGAGNWRVLNLSRADGTPASRYEGPSVASASDCDIWATGGDTVHVTGTTTITDWGTAPRAGAFKRVIFDGALTLTYNATTNDIDGGADVTTAANDECIVYAESASAYRVKNYIRASGKPLNSIVSPSAATSLSGGSTTVTGIPSWATRVTVVVWGASHNSISTPSLGLRLGYSGGVEATGYASAASTGNSTTEFHIADSISSSASVYGIATIFKVPGTNQWVCSSTMNDGSTARYTQSGAKTVSGGALDRVQLLVSTDSFNSGTMTVSWE